MISIDDSWYHPLPNLPEETSAGGIVVRRAAQLWVALVRERRSPKFVLPKGRLEPGETLEQAAYREIAEEAGLTDLQLLADLGRRERLSFSKRSWKKVHYFLFQTRQIQPNPSRQEPDSELHWFPLDELPDLFWPEQKALIDFNRDRIKSLMH
ncbi:MAG: NUDIX domain-containing protein [Synechococcales cyanobacterium C42_A2020_086]|jgi:8-oxo-dGTP pyrophosphatase MutT (NUDIX family)|nr:NUDIX domain-containing protein [Synechococcales cyanobacterium M58_A2018_015]MBF2074684.1 NUDIX domain-containing protein [Synechococcales cyanobacterium C42_A2020_086]